MSYAELDAKLRDRHGREVDSRKVGNNTYAHRRADGIGVRLHNTDVVIWHPDETVTLNTGGWFTVTTKARINTWAAPFGVYSVKGNWVVIVRNPGDGPYWLTVGQFHDGMTLDGNNPTATLATPADVQAAMAADGATKRAVARYVKGITADVIARAIDNAGGDCWACRFDMPGTDHLVSHMEEGYYVAHLFKLALDAAGYRDPGLILHMRSPDLVKRAVRRYLLAKLLVGPTSGRKAEPVAHASGF